MKWTQRRASGGDAPQMRLWGNLETSTEMLLCRLPCRYAR